MKNEGLLSRAAGFLAIWASMAPPFGNLDSLRKEDYYEEL
jgi:hypothetical protein